MDRVATVLLPKKQAKAVELEAECNFGCGRNGVYHVVGRKPSGKPPCC